MLNSFMLCLIPLFVAVDPIASVPVFLGLTEEIEKSAHAKLVIQAVLTALIVGVLFLIGGRFVLRVLGISIADFMIAGGIILFALSVENLISYEKKHKVASQIGLGAVPIGVPLMVGPAVLTTGILLLDQHGFMLTTSALILNILLAGTAFYFSTSLSNIFGKTGMKVASKLSSLLLAAYAVMMVRKGIQSMISISGFGIDTFFS
jgi:multiple antibiotic resistance protein